MREEVAMVDRRFLAVLLVAAAAIGCDRGEQEREQAEDAAIEAEVMALVHQAGAIGGPPDAATLRKLADPAGREWLSSLTEEERAYHLAKEELGLLFIEAGSLPAPLSQFEMRGVWRTGDAGESTIRHGSLDLRFPVVRVEGRWLLGVGKVLRVIHR